MIVRLARQYQPAELLCSTLEATGNRDSVTVDGVTTDYTYNVLDQLVSTSSPTGTVAYTYDGRGNLDQVTAGSQTTDYTYNAADRLANVTLPDTTILTYGYNADGRRIKQTVGAQVTNYLWDEASVYGDVVLETDSSGATLASYVLDERWIVSQSRSGVTNYYLQDGQGSTRALTNAAGNVTDTYSYNAFGELLNQTGSTANNYLYTGQQFDALTGLYDLRARYYDPAMGRFLSQDTYPVNFGNPVELNRYVYTANNPINRMDPTGYNTASESTISWSMSAQIGRQAGAFMVKRAALVFGAIALGVFIGVLFRPLVGAPPKGGTTTAVDAFEEAAWEAQVAWLMGGDPGGGNDSGWVIISIIAAVAGIAVSSYYSGREQSKDESESQKPIVLDLGPSNNFAGEIVPLVNHYRGRAKVIGIDADFDPTLMQSPAELGLADFHYIRANYGSKGIAGTLAAWGYNQCAIAAYSLWPSISLSKDDATVNALPNAAGQLLCPGGAIYIVSDNLRYLKDIAGKLNGFEIVLDPDKSLTWQCIANPACSPLRIGFSSPESYAKSGYQYILTATKR